ncbi:YadA C-terminal domain-containing protein [Neptuniibacter sp. QD34_54]|uniref:YadA C-terminal domain-containing protein n=1 Tax=Neptuniibacter sp. QD34_54 TaxID=3398208 RepID=UPI0039F4A459
MRPIESKKYLGVLLLSISTSVLATDPAVDGDAVAVPDVDNEIFQLNGTVTTNTGNITTNTGNITTNTGNIATNAANIAALSSNTTSINRLNQELDELKDDAFSGIAAAIALGAVQMPSAPGKTAISIGTGYYAGESALGINVTHAVAGWGANKGNISGGIAGAGSNGEIAARMSVGFEF